MRTTEHGFTFIEVVLVVAMVAVLSVAGFQIRSGLVNSRTSSSAAQQVLDAARSAQTMSLAMLDDSPWGIRVASVSVTLFKGSQWEAHDAGADTETLFAYPVSLAEPVVVTFTKGSGLPTAPRSFTLAVGDASTTITIDAAGTLSTRDEP
jgi:prepilin-type N-terminal cleavage/methylation domain-containing protein